MQFSESFHITDYQPGSKLLPSCQMELQSIFTFFDFEAALHWLCRVEPKIGLTSNSQLPQITFTLLSLTAAWINILIQKVVKIHF